MKKWRNSMLKKMNNDEFEKLEQQVLQRENFQIIRTCQKFSIKKHIDKILVVINSSEIANHRKTKQLLSRLLKLQRKCIKHDIDWEITMENESISAIFIDNKGVEINSKFYNELEVVVNMAQIKGKRSRIEYIYDKSCEYLDNECRRLNYCDFKNDVCIAKRNPCRGKEKKMGCCYHVKLFSFKESKMCEYLSKDGSCSAKCFACKLFTCDAIKEKYRIRDITYADCFFNLLQKLVIRVSILTPRDKIISRLLWL